MHPERISGFTGKEHESYTNKRIDLRIERIGERPTSAFFAGFHGDEGGVIQPLRAVLTTLAFYPDRPLGDHLHLLEAHPLALAEGTRTYHGEDLNRLFTATTVIDHPHAGKIAEAIKAHPDLHTLFTFHEDTEDDRFYFYYHPCTTEFGVNDQLAHTLRDRLLEKVQKIGLSLYTDIDEPGLGNMIVGGYAECPADGEHDNTVEMWAVNKSAVNHPNLTRSFAFEVPSSLSYEKKCELLAIIFTDFILPYMAACNDH